MILILLIAFFISFVTTLIVSKYGLKFGLVDIPNVRSSHKNITPRGGGIGITIALFVVMFFVKELYMVVLIGVFLSVFSLIDDRINLPVLLRFFVEIVSAFIIVIFYKNNLISEIIYNHGITIGIIAIVIVAIIITSATNFFNFMDGINGIAGFEAIISFGLLAYYVNHVNVNGPVLLISLVIITSTIGFLFFNFPKAKVFMGDVGSILLGFIFVSLIVIISKDLREFLILLLFQSVFYIDCISTIIIRKYRKENILKPHLQHFYQRLVHQKEHTHVFVTLIYGIIQLIIGLLALVFMQKDIILVMSFWVFLFAFYMIIRVKYLKN